MKRISCTTLLLLAILLLVAHEVIPHHHHDGDIHSDFNDCGQEHCHFPMKDEDHHRSESECCVLSDVVVLLPCHHYYRISSSCANDQYAPNVYFTAHFGYINGNGFFCANSPLWSYPDKNPFYHSFAGYCKGLRAPPFS